jgi:hypothetical protein
MVWSKEEIRKLKQAYKIVARAELSKSEKWARVAESVGGGRSKHDCYNKYKELLEDRAREKAELRSKAEAKGGDPRRPRYALQHSESTMSASALDPDDDQPPSR